MVFRMQSIFKKSVFFILLIFFIGLIPTISAQEGKIEVDLSSVHWTEQTTFIYDNTEKKVELEGYPEDIIKVRYLNNTGTLVRSYTAQAELDYDENLYTIVNFDWSILKNHQWEIVIGKYNTSNMILRSKSFLENNEVQSLEVENLPDGLTVTYENNGHAEPGIYIVKATFTGNQYFEEVQPQEATLTILKKNVKTETENAIFQSDFGFHPNLELSCSWKEDLSSYSDVDLTAIGTYREVRASFDLNLTLNGKMELLNHQVRATIVLPEELRGDKDLALYDFSSGQPVNIKCNLDKNNISFNLDTIATDYVLVGIRNTYTSNPIWKAFLIFGIILLFVIGAFILRFIYKKKRGYTR